MVDKDIEWLYTLKGLLESGIFFGLDLMDEVIITTLKKASVRCISDHCHGIIDDTPSIFWVLQVRPYCNMIMSLFLRYLGQERNVDKEACYTEVNGLLHLVGYMTRDEQDEYALSLCLMIEKLDYWQNEDGDDEDSDAEFATYAVPPGTFSNVALEVLGVLGRMSIQCASLIMRYIDIDSGDAQVATMRQRRGLQVIERGLTSEELHELLAPLPDEHFLTLFSGETDLTDFAEWSICIYLLRILIKANRRVGESALRDIAWDIDSRGTFQEGWQRVRDPFRELCELSVAPDVVRQLMIRAGSTG